MSENKSKRPSPIIFGCSGVQLTSAERAAFKRANPLGFILFKRNCESPEQLKYLIMELKNAVGREDIDIAIDQEGGRVSRLQPPHWTSYPSARTFGQLYEDDHEQGIDALKRYARIIAWELARLGFTINCAPVVDLFNSMETPAIGNRAFSAQPGAVAALARALAETFIANGILPVIKHLPGHGRLRADPHHMLPIIDASKTALESEDFVPFSLLKDLPLGMNSHAIFSALDPDKPASLSPVVNNEIIRGLLGFDGLLLSDDINMKALKGAADDLTLQALRAGNDVVLHCNGEIKEIEDITKVLDPMNDASWTRLCHAKAMLGVQNKSYDPAEDIENLDIILGGIAFGDKTERAKSCSK